MGFLFQISSLSSWKKCCCVANCWHRFCACRSLRRSRFRGFGSVSRVRIELLLENPCDDAVFFSIFLCVVYLFTTSYFPHDTQSTTSAEPAIYFRILSNYRTTQHATKHPTNITKVHAQPTKPPRPNPSAQAPSSRPSSPKPAAWSSTSVQAQEPRHPSSPTRT